MHILLVMPNAPAIDVTVEMVEDSLVSLVRHLSSVRTWRRIAVATSTPLDRARYIVLRAVSEHAPTRTSELADAVGVDQSTMSRHVKILEEAGYVSRVADPSDGRASALSITRAGARVMDRVRDARHQLIAEALDDWAPADRALLAPLLARLASDFDRLEGRV
jgi:DNA-binding MarR family transcriptional regulator